MWFLKKSFQFVVSTYFGKKKLIDQNMAPLFYLIRNTWLHITYPKSVLWANIFKHLFENAQNLNPAKNTQIYQYRIKKNHEKLCKFSYDTKLIQCMLLLVMAANKILWELLFFVALLKKLNKAWHKRLVGHGVH